jgi:Cyclin, N-terminal domain
MNDSSLEDDGSSNKKQKETRLTLLDRSLIVLLPDPDDTPSRRLGVPAQAELCHHLHGTSVIYDVFTLLQSNPLEANDKSASKSTTNASRSSHSVELVAPTACVLFHRYYHRVSLQDRDVWSTAIACISIAQKVHHLPYSNRRIVKAAAHIYQRRVSLRLLQNVGTETDIDTSSSNNNFLWANGHLPQNVVAQILSHTSPTAAALKQPSAPLTSDTLHWYNNGPVETAWLEALVAAEQDILRQLGFVLYWIPLSHPHSCIPIEFLQDFFRQSTLVDGSDCGNGSKAESALNTKDTAASGHSIDEPLHNKATDALQKALYDIWNLCNDAMRLDLCVRIKPQVVTCAAVQIVAWENGWELPTNWYEPILTDESVSSIRQSQEAQALSDTCNALLGLREQDNTQVLVATQAFLPSLVPNGSFNDPTSYLWFCLQEALEKSQSEVNESTE